MPQRAGGTQAIIGSGALARLAPMLAGRAAVVLADRHVLSLHHALLKPISGSIRTVVKLPRGESAKSPEAIAEVWRRLAAIGLPRSGVVIAMGGGAALDAAGFVASTWLRGVDWIAVPTTLLAQADACLGGKTAIDLELGKNLVGTFHAPRLALADPAPLRTVPEADYRAARFELLKCAWLGDAELGRLALSAALARREPAVVARAVTRALRCKAVLVAADPFDRGCRRLLNLGHTFGHALEAASGFRLRHGDAVGLGLLAALFAARELGLVSDAELARRRAELARLGLRRVSPELLPAACAAAWLDKKNEAREATKREGLTLVLPAGNTAVVRRQVSPELFELSLAAALER